MIGLRHFLTMLSVCLFAVALSSCEHRELTDPTDVHYLRVYLDEKIKNVTDGFYNESYERPDYNKPQNIRAALASAQTGQIVAETLLRNHGSDKKGSYIDGYIGAPAGEYNLVMYQLGSPVTQIKNPDAYHDIAVYTQPVSDRVMNYLPQIGKVVDRENIVEEPEHILMSRCENILISHSLTVDTLRTSNGEYFTARTAAKSYYIQLRIFGVEWVSAAAAVLSGMSGSSKMSEENGAVKDDPVHVFFSMNYADKNKRASDEVSSAILYSTFTTFGIIPETASELTLRFEFTKKDGSTQVETFDITEEFKTPLAIEKQWLILDKEIRITRPESTGGMAPGLEGWKDIDSDLPM